MIIKLLQAEATNKAKPISFQSHTRFPILKEEAFKVHQVLNERANS